MRSVGIRELRERTSEIIRWVREEGAEVQVTHYGRPVARLVPVASEPAADGTSVGDQTAAVWAELDQLAAEIGARWPDGFSAAGAVAEGRREL
jgi:prevent-host-death family protein